MHYNYRDSIRYIFGPLIQTHLNQYLQEWNHHRIRFSRMAEIPAGIPEVLYRFPELHSMADLYTCQYNSIFV